MSGHPCLFEANQTILFIGDSITDAGRVRDDPTELGRGYAKMAAGQAGFRRPDFNLRFLNRGIGGNRIGDLEARWEEDCLALEPDWVSILIGVNDTWRRYDRDMPSTTENFEETYRGLLERTRQVGIKLILCEQFLLTCGKVQWSWREDIDPKIQATRRLANDFAEAFVPFDGLFQSAARRAPATYWAPDGVHPSAAGHALMAHAWLTATGFLP